MLLSRISIDKTQHIFDKNLSSFDIQLQSFKGILSLLILFGSLIPNRFALIIDSDLNPFLCSTLFETLRIGIHLSMSLSHHKSFFLSIRHNRKLNRLLPEPSFLTISSNNWCNCWSRTFVSENVFRFLEVVEVVQVYSYDLLPCLSVFIGLLCLFKGPLGLFSFSVFH